MSSITSGLKLLPRSYYSSLAKNATRPRFNGDGLCGQNVGLNPNPSSKTNLFSSMSVRNNNLLVIRPGSDYLVNWGTPHHPMIWHRQRQTEFVLKTGLAFSQIDFSPFTSHRIIVFLYWIVRQGNPMFSPVAQTRENESYVCWNPIDPHQAFHH